MHLKFTNLQPYLPRWRRFDPYDVFPILYMQSSFFLLLLRWYDDGASFHYSLQSATHAASHNWTPKRRLPATSKLIIKLLLAIKYTKAAWLIHQLLKAAFSHACAQFSCLLIDVIIYYISTGLALAKLNCNLVILDDRKSWKQKLLEICWSASWSQLRSF